MLLVITIVIFCSSISLRRLGTKVRPRFAISSSSVWYRHYLAVYQLQIHILCKLASTLGTRRFIRWSENMAEDEDSNKGLELHGGMPISLSKLLRHWCAINVLPHRGMSKLWVYALRAFELNHVQQRWIVLKQLLEITLHMNGQTKVVNHMIFHLLWGYNSQHLKTWDESLSYL